MKWVGMFFRIFAFVLAAFIAVVAVSVAVAFVCVLLFGTKLGPAITALILLSMAIAAIVTIVNALD